MLALEIILFVVAILVIALCLLQGGKSDGASATIMGGMGNKSFADLKERGAEKVLTNITFVLAGVFFFLVALARILEKGII